MGVCSRDQRKIKGISNIGKKDVSVPDIVLVKRHGFTRCLIGISRHEHVVAQRLNLDVIIKRKNILKRLVFLQRFQSLVDILTAGLVLRHGIAVYLALFARASDDYRRLIVLK